MVSQTATTSNLSEAIINVQRIEKNLLHRQYSCLDRDRNKIRANIDRHMETFLQYTRKRHEGWYRNDNHFREAIRKEKDQYEKRKVLNRQKFLFATNPNYVPSVQTPFQPIDLDDTMLPPITRSPSPKPNPLPSTNTTPRLEPMTKVERRTQQVLRASQKLLDESAARSRSKLEFDRPTSSSFNYKKPPPSSQPTSSSCSFNSATLIVPLTTTIAIEEYDRLMNESIQREAFGEFVDHIVKFRPEYREQFGVIYEGNKRQKAMEKLRTFNQKHAKTKDERYHNLINSLTDLRSEQKEKYY